MTLETSFNKTLTKLAISHKKSPELPKDKLFYPPNLVDILLEAAKIEQAIVYIQSDKSEIIQTYQDLLIQAQKILSGLRKLGLKPEDKVVFQIESYQDLINAFWGCILGGFIPVPVSSTAYTPEKINKTTSKLCHTLEMLEFPLLLTDANFAAEIPNIPELSQMGNFPVATVEELRKNEPDTDWHNSQSGDVAVMMLTSGSTGAPKGVLLSHKNLISQVLGSVQMNGFTKEDVTLNWVPIDHVAGLIYFHIRDVYLGSKQIHFPFELLLKEPLTWLDLIDRFKVSITFAPNFVYGLINDYAEVIPQRKWDLSSVKFILNGAEAIVAKTARHFLQLLVPHGLNPIVMCPSWGMAEVSSGVTFSHKFSLDSATDDDLFVEVGSPIPGIQLRIVDDKNQLRQEEEIGALQVKGLTVTPGYYQNPTANQKAFTEDGWFNTGDLGFLKDSCLTITGRQKDVIIICGNNYYCHEIEAAVEEVKGVEVSYTAATAIRESGSNTDKLAIFFSTTNTENQEKNSDEVLMQKISQAVGEKIGVSPDYLIPVSPETIPKTAIGKIKRQELKKRFEEGEFIASLKSK